MVTRRIATAATLLVVLGAGCASHGAANVAAGPDAAVITPAAAVVASIPATSTTVAPVAEPAAEAAPEAAAQPAADPVPVVKSAPTPAPASIEVDYQPLAGATATATIDGPNGTHSKSLDSGAALFGGLPAGTYAVTITIDSPSGDPSIGAARVYLNGGEIHLDAGDQGVVACDDSGCTGPL